MFQTMTINRIYNLHSLLRVSTLHRPQCHSSTEVFLAQTGYLKSWKHPTAVVQGFFLCFFLTPSSPSKTTVKYRSILECWSKSFYLLSLVDDQMIFFMPISRLILGCIACHKLELELCISKYFYLFSELKNGYRFLSNTSFGSWQRIHTIKTKKTIASISVENKEWHKVNYYGFSRKIFYITPSG